MLRRALLIVLALLLPAPAALAQTAIAEATAETASAPLPRVALETDIGRIVLELDVHAAPVTTANFLRYVDEGRFEGKSFYRAMNLGGGFGIIQGGTNNDPERILPPIAHEPTTQTGLSHVSGTVSMTRYDVGTATGDFFITIGDLRSYDAGRSNSLEAEGYAAFGKVVEGMDVVRTIMLAPTSPTLGEGFMRGQMLEPVITITRTWRVADTPPEPVAP